MVGADVSYHVEFLHTTIPLLPNFEISVERLEFDCSVTGGSCWPNSGSPSSCRGDREARFRFVAELSRNNCICPLALSF